MDRLSIFPSHTSEVTFKSEENNSIDTVIDKLDGVKRELKLTRKGNEAFVYGEDVEDSEEVDLEEVDNES